MMTAETANRLVDEKSPYLQQHAHNPVEWYPWGPEAFERARKENKPMFLSVGYATCHWCHVMEKETFEDAEAAAHLNDTFVCIKVDREERPDADADFILTRMHRSDGGFFLTASDATDLPVRPKDLYDGAIPSANAVALMNLLTLFRLTGSPEWEQLAQGLGTAFAGTLKKGPTAFTFSLCALDFAIRMVELNTVPV